MTVNFNILNTEKEVKMEKISFSQLVKTGKKKSLRCLGMDLGTTKSTVTEIVLDPGQSPEPVVNCLKVEQKTSEGKCFGVSIPSMLAIFNGETFIGEGAKQLLAEAGVKGLMARRNIFYECKNEMGITKTYHHAPVGYRCASDIAGHLLSFMKDAACEANKTRPARTVITVPASFQAAQRNDTLKAAGLAGIGVEKGGLLDEPVAAFLDYLFTFGLNGFSIEDKPKNLMVFDFGGGTCDVALFKISLAEGGGIGISPLGVSHYHRLGGGDIDAAIVYDILFPQMCKQNGFEQNELTFNDKKYSLEPALRNVAEDLKVALCGKVREMAKAGTLEKAKKSEISVRNEGTFICNFRESGRRCVFNKPELTLEAFEGLLEPFINTDMLYARDTEYRLTCSIFSPVSDCLDRSDINPVEVHACLMAGGSSLIPQVQKAMRGFLTKATLLCYPDDTAAKTTVSRGAAYHALALALTGKGIITPISADGLSIKTEQGPVEIIPKGVRLPYPQTGFGVYRGLAVPEQALLNAVKVRVELVESEDEKPVFSGLWNIEGSIVNKGDPISLEYRYDENQNLCLKFAVADGINRAPFLADIQNPVTMVINPQRARVKILEIEEDLRTGIVPKYLLKEKGIAVAQLYAEIGQREKAISRLKWCLKVTGQADAWVLNRIGLLYGELGNRKLEELMYIEATKVNAVWGGPLFNLAIARRDQGQLDGALECADAAIAKEPSSAYKVLKGMLLQKSGKKKEGEQIIDDAFKDFSPVNAQDEWELGWYASAASLLGKDKIAEEARKIIKEKAHEKENNRETWEPIKVGLLPVLAQEK